METLGTKLRRQRRRLGLTLEELAGKTGISKPYLSLIETGRVANPPSDQKLRQLEHSLGFTHGDLVGQAHLQRTPHDIRAMLGWLLAQRTKTDGQPVAQAVAQSVGPANAVAAPSAALHHAGLMAAGIDLDDAFVSGVLQELADQQGSNIDPVTTRQVPVINRVSAGYPRDFTDLSYPPRIADDYVGCPDLDDKDAFAARVHGDSMSPKYRQGDIVIFSPAAAVQGHGDDCFVRFDDAHTTFKRVYFETDDTGTAVIRLQPRNERYRPQVVPSERVSGLYRAMFKYMRVDDE